MKKLIAIVIALTVVAGGAAWWWKAREASRAVTYRTAEVKRTDLVSSITATGTLEPEEVVDVGAQVAGMIIEFGKDVKGHTIDYGSVVDQGTILAKIDPSLYESDVAQMTAQLDSANASVARAQADVVQARAKADQAQRDWERAQRLGPSELLAQSAYDAYKATFDAAVANVGVTQAAVAQAQASVSLAQAQLDRAKRNLGYCIITSPVRGTIIDRRVNTGQTVVSSLNAPSLFLIAKDLKRMQVWAAVNEADVSSIHAGQPAHFTVDAFPGRTFRGEVIKVRLNAAMTQNVVTYTVEIAADNSDEVLLPYLTANVSFITQERDNALVVPNAALHYDPPPERIDPSVANSESAPNTRPAPAGESAEAAAPAASGAPPGAGAAGPGGATADRPRGDRDRAGAPGASGTTGAANQRRGAGRSTWGTIWVQTIGPYVRPIRVRTGVTDGAMTEVQSPDLQEGLAVVTGEQQPQAAASPQGSNPFAPPVMRRGRRGGR